MYTHILIWSTVQVAVVTWYVFPKKLTLAGTVQSRMEYKRELYMTHPLDPSIPLSHTGELLTTALLGKQL